MSDRVHLLEAQPFDESAEVELGGPPWPFGDALFGGTIEAAPNLTFSFATGEGRLIYLADGGFNSHPADDPANQHYEPTLLEPFNFQVRLFSGLEPTGRANESFGDIVAHNGDGYFDALTDSGWSGRPIMLYRAVPHEPRAGAELVFSGTVDGVTPDEERFIMRLRSRDELLNRPLMSSLYAGSGGAEGGADLAGKRKPLCYGHAFNIAPPLIDAANLVFQVHGAGPINAITEVRDRGVPLTFNGSDYATYAALAAASIAAGEYATCLAEGMFRLGGAPDGLVTCDVEGDAAGGVFVETTGTIIRRIVTTRLDTVNLTDPDDLDTASFSALESAQPAEIGFYEGPDSSLTVGQALDQLMAAIGGWWTFTLPGLLTVQRLEAPTGTAAVTLQRGEIAQGRPFALEGGVPSYRRRVTYQRSHAVQSPDSLAGAVTDADKLTYGQQFRFATAADAAVLLQHRGARDVETLSFFRDEADASAEATRLQALHGVPRRVVSVGVRPDDPFAAPLGQVVEVVEFNRLGLASSKKFICIGVSASLATGAVEWLLWG